VNVRFLVPWRSDGEYRDKLWDFCRARLERDYPGIPIVMGESPPGAFNRSAAINNAAAGEWEIAVVLDADVICEWVQMAEAIATALETGHLTFAFDEYRGLTPHMTAKVLSDPIPQNRWSPEPQWQSAEVWNKGVRFRSKVHESSVVVVRRDLWDELGGFDERFVGWGQEDVAFAQAARVLDGEPIRIPGPVWHLWHERSADRNEHLGRYRANQLLGDRYRGTSDPEAMLELLRERDDARASLREHLPA
jgi:GT2 family glycosyltransferase